MPKPYRVAVVQTHIEQLTDVRQRDAVVRQNLERSLELAGEAVACGGSRIVLFPEFWLHGAFQRDGGTTDWLGCACDLDGGWEVQALGEAAAHWGVYLAGSLYERHPAFPGRIFNTGILVGPDGKLVLRHRQHYYGSLDGVLPVTEPADVYDRFVEVFGKEALFPVARTPLGNIAFNICYEVNFFEVARVLALKGAELFLQPTGEPHAPHRAAWEQARRTRAYENTSYWASANYGSVGGSRAPRFRSHGRSEVIGFDGKPLAVCDGPGEALVAAEVDIEALRWRREQIGLNFVVQCRTALYGPEYGRVEGLPLNVGAAAPMQDRTEGPARVREVIGCYQQQGIMKRPGPLQEAVAPASASGLGGAR